MLPIKVRDSEIHIGRFFSVSFQRTLRIPDDGKTYPLPPGLGNFPLCRVADYADRVPTHWNEHGGVFIPMYQREALWLSFHGKSWHPNALKVGVGKINALSGSGWDQTLSSGRQDYCVVPDQPWLDGINAGDGYIRQFVAMPLGMGYTVEAQITNKEEFGGIQLIVYEAVDGRFRETPPADLHTRTKMILCCPAVASTFAGAEMGLAAGGRMRQRIYRDAYGIDSWDHENYGRVYVHLVNSAAFREITGLEPPPTPVSARSYTEFGFPWFALYDEDKDGIKAQPELSAVKSVKELDAEKGFQPQEDDMTIETKNVRLIGKGFREIPDGDW